MKYKKIMTKPEKYAVYATSQEGDGYTMWLGEYEDPTDIEINTSIIGSGVKITIERV